jgi:hypothetical protein
MLSPTFCLLMVAPLVGCGVQSRGAQPPVMPTSDNSADMATLFTPQGGDDAAGVFANSASALYRVDPDTLKVSLIGQFGWPSGTDSMTDIALDKTGKMIGVSFNKVYAVSTKDAKCTALASLDVNFNGLSFVPAQAVDGTDGEELVGSTIDGSFYRINPQTGAATRIGAYGLGVGSSGDVVSVTGFGTVATVTKFGDPFDWLARIDPQTGVATLIGSTGVMGIWGLGFWKNKIFGFTMDNKFVLINPNTGASQMVQAGQVSWWGAGVSTSAPVIQ